MNHAFARAWGEPGIPGDDMEIVSTCRLFAEMCSSALAWEEQVRFVTTDEAFRQVASLLPGVVGGMIDEAAKVPKFMADSFARQPVPGTYALSLELKLPDGWAEQIGEAMERAMEEVIAGIEAGEISY